MRHGKGTVKKIDGKKYSQKWFHGEMIKEME